MFPRGHATNGLITRNTRNRDETGSFNSLPRKSLSRQVQKKMTRFNMRQLSLQFILYTFVNHTRQKQKHVRDALNFSNYHLSKCSFEQRYRIPRSAKPFILIYPRLSKTLTLVTVIQSIFTIALPIQSLRDLQAQLLNLF